MLAGMASHPAGVPARALGLLAALLLTAPGCGAAPRPPSLANPLGAYNFTLESRPPAEQVRLLEELGYAGVVMFYPGAEAFESFAAVPSVRQGRFRLYAVIVELHFATSWSREEMDAMLSTLAPQGTDVWLILTGPAGMQEALSAAVREVVERATARGVRVVVYPHDGHAVETAEEARTLLAAVGRPELKSSLHLSHELKAGHRDRLAEVITATAPGLVLASINGASRQTDAPDWSAVIQPLDRGDLDVREEYLLPLIRSGYTGPLLLHTFGIEEPPEEHFRRSYETWERMSREVAATLASEP